MKLLSGVLVSLILLFAGAAQAAPIDLSGFTAFGASAAYVDIDSDSIDITEVDDFGAYFAVNDAFAVPDDAGLLTFVLSMDPSPADYDWFVVRVNDGLSFEANESQSGSVDLSPFRGQTISLAFGLESGDQFGGTEGTFSQIDLSTSTVPEPSTLLLLGIGLAGFVGMRRRMHNRRA